MLFASKVGIGAGDGTKQINKHDHHIRMHYMINMEIKHNMLEINISLPHPRTECMR